MPYAMYSYWHTTTIRRTETCTCVTILKWHCANNQRCVKRESRLLLMGFRSEIWLLLQWTIVTVTTDDPRVFYSTLCSDTLWLRLKLCQGDVSYDFLSRSFGKVEGDTFFRFNILKSYIARPLLWNRIKATITDVRRVLFNAKHL